MMAITEQPLTHHDRAGYEMVIKNLKVPKAEFDTLRGTVAELRYRLAAIDNYDRTVKAAIASDERLVEAWDNFAVSYQMIADDELMTRARDKVWKAEGTTRDICPSCKMIKNRTLGGLESWERVS